MTFTEDFFTYGSTFLDTDIVHLIDSYTKENVTYIKTLVGFDDKGIDPNNPGVNLDGIIYREKSYGVYYKRVFENEINVLWFKAKVNGAQSDFYAFQGAHFFASKTPYKTIVLPETCDLDFRGETQSFGSEIILKFDGGTISNGTLEGNHTMIVSAPYYIFKNVSLIGSWTTTDNFAYPEWFGTIPGDEQSVDLKCSLEKLVKFENIKFGKGEYFSKMGEIPVRYFEGTSKLESFITIHLDESTTGVKYGLCLGKYEGLVLAPDKRSDYNTLKELTIKTIFTNTNEIKSKKINYSGVVMGNVHGGKVDSVRILQNTPGIMLCDEDLESLMADVEKNYKEANIGLEFKGCSELCIVNNLETYSDVGIGFNTTLIDSSQIQGVDFPSIYNFYSDCGLFGLASVFFGAPNVFNLTMYGIQSWCQGMYGLYSCKSPEDMYTSFMHCSINNVRVEQLSNLKDADDKVRSASIYIAKQDNIENLIINNVRFSGLSNGLYLGGAKRGYFEISNVSIGGDDVNLQYFIKTSHNEDSSFAIKFKNVTADMNYPVIHDNATVIDSHYHQKFHNAPYKINYHDVTVVRRTEGLVRYEKDGSRKFLQNEAAAAGEWLKLYHSNIVNVNPNLIYEIWDASDHFTLYKLEAISQSFYVNLTMTLFRDGSYINEPYDSTMIFVGDSTNIQPDKINVVCQQSTGFWFLINNLSNQTVQYNIKGLIK